ncbi:hypothetical protein F5887DRAFT_215238 [Amanita rubescens]|nr:hypothetical protein F5887DRAFT_215238 [Amanita rubescens]
MKSFSLVILLPLAGIASAQFQFFDSMFGHPQQQQHHHQQRTGAEQYAALVDEVSCPGYLCPVTLDCVENPTYCPCPDEEDVKCIIPDIDSHRPGDGTVVCVRGAHGCAQVDRLLHTRKM